MIPKFLLPILSAALLGFAIFHVKGAQTTPPKEEPPIPPAKNPFGNTIAGGGIVEPRSENIAVGSPLPGLVKEVFVHVNQRVKEKQELFRLDDRALQAEYSFRKSILEASKAQLARLESLPRPEELPPLQARVAEADANLNDAIDQYNRAQQVYATRAIGQEELIKRKNGVAIAEALKQKAEADLKLMKAGAWLPDLLIARRAVEQAESQLKQTQQELDRLTICAPVAGEILQLNVRKGEYVGVPASQPLIYLGDTETLHVRMDVDENDLTRFRQDLTGVATRRGDAKNKIPLKFVRVEPFVVPKKSLTGAGTERVDTRVLPVIFAVEKSPVPLYVGQQLDVYLEVKGEK